MEAPTVRRLAYNGLERCASWMLDAAERVGSPLALLDGDSIRRRAQHLNRCTDWGDERFIAPMERMLEEVRRSDIPAFGRAAERALAIRGVSNRLRMKRWLDAYPEVRDIPIERPVFVLGFPRTGTTVTQNLLCLEPGWRALEFWELIRPAPVYMDPERDRRKRVSMASWDLWLALKSAPEMQRIHAMTPWSREECWYLFANTFSVLNFDIAHGLRDYGDWLLEQDMVWAYESYRTQLQILLHRNPAERLVLKCPEHLWFLDALLEVFPDACIVWTHRDPFEVIPSYCSMTALVRRPIYGEVDQPAIGEHLTSRFVQGVERAMAVHQRLAPSQIYDVSFRDLLEDPAGVVRDIKAHFQLQSSDGAEAAVAEYLGRPRPDARGRHVYRAEDYGVRPKELERAFADYLTRFPAARR